jgi:hypothetical protein
MTNKLAKTTILGASSWKFLLLIAALLLSYSMPAHADSHEEAQPEEAAPA